MTVLGKGCVVTLLHLCLCKTQEGEVIVIPCKPQKQHQTFMSKTLVNVGRAGGQPAKAAFPDTVTNVEDKFEGFCRLSYQDHSAGAYKRKRRTLALVRVLCPRVGFSIRQTVLLQPTHKNATMFIVQKESGIP